MTRYSSWSVALALLVGFVVTNSATAGYIFSNVPRTGTGSGYSWNFDSPNTVDGYRFRVGTSQLQVLSLGMFDSAETGSVNQEGLYEAHQVGIWTSTGTLLASVTVGAGVSAPLVDGFRYVSLNTTVLLNPGQSYVVGALYPDFGGPGSPRPNDWLRQLTFGGINSRISNLVTFEGGVSGLEGAGMVFPNEYFAPNQAFLGGNAFFVEVPVPHGAAIAGVGIGVLFFARRFKRKT